MRSSAKGLTRKTCVFVQKRSSVNGALVNVRAQIILNVKHPSRLHMESVDENNEITFKQTFISINCLSYQKL